MRDLTQLDEQILETAREMILKKGILETDMKDIAQVIGCSRSTLYRHFPGKGDILLILADRALDIIRQAQIIPANYRFASGYEAFAWQLHSVLDAMIHHVDEVLFLRDFDCLYAKHFPNEESAAEFVGKVSHSTAESPMQQSYNRGIEDGSIKPDSDPELFILMVFQSLMALAQRILPVEDTYISAYGYGQEIVRNYVRVICESVKST